MRVLLVTGKGGVGKTTTAAATAVHAARRGHKTLLVSTDAAHSVGDVLGARPGADPTEVADGLFALHVDTRSAFEQRWRSVQGWLAGLLEQAGIASAEAEQLTVLPGAEEVLALVELRRQVEGDRFDVVVVDCAPTGETLRLLALPEAMRWWVDRVFSPQRRLLRSARPLLGQLTGLPLPPDEVFDAARALTDELTAVRALLVDPARCSVRLVCTPEAMALAETRRAATALSLHGYRVDGLVVSRVVPDDLSGAVSDWQRSWVAVQRRQLQELAASFPQLPRWSTPHLASEPTGVDALAELALTTYGDDDPLRVGDVDDPLAVEQVSGDEFVLVLGLPHASLEEVELARDGDDLVVTVGPWRRIVTLPSVLRRCVVTGAGLRDGALRVRFAADPALWRAP